MLKKLFKYDWKSFWKVPAAINLFLVIITVIGIISLISPVWQIESEIVYALMSMAIMFYILALFAGNIAVSVYIAVRYYKNIYTDEGYLTNTLPVTARQIILSKIFISVIWSIITGLVVALSVFSLLFTAFYVYGDANMINDFINEMAQVWSIMLATLDISNFTVWLYAFVSVFAGTFFSTIMVYCAIALGQLFTSHKIAGAVVWYIAEYVIIQTVSSLFLNMPYIINANSIYYFDDTVSLVIKPIMIVSLLLTIIVSIAMYFISEYMLKKRLNLE